MRPAAAGFDRLTFVLGGLAFSPTKTWKAFRRGLQERNLYPLEPEDVLGKDIEELRRYCHSSD